MPVLTKKQFKEAKAALITPASGPVTEAGTHTAGAEKSAPAQPPKPKDILQYVVMYPEIPVNGPRPSFDGKAVLGGKEKRYRCESGIVRTNDKDLADHLVQVAGHVLLEIKENVLEGV